MLALVFYGVVTPFALVFRLRGRDVLARKKRPVDSYWSARRESNDPRSYFRQF